MPVLTRHRKRDRVHHVKKAVTGRSIPYFPGKREDGWCESLRERGEGALEPRSGNAPPDPAVTGNEVRASQARIQVEPRIVLIRPEPLGSGCFFLP